MKKIYLSIVVLVCAVNFSHAQNTFPSTGNAGIGTTSPAAFLHVMGSTEQLRLGYDASHYTSFATNMNETLFITNSGGVSVSAGFGAGGNWASFWTDGSNGLLNPAIPEYVLFGSNNVQLKFGERSNINGTVSVGYTYGTHIIGQTAVTIASSGTHPLFAQQIIKPLAISSGAGTVLNSATLYLEDATSGATHNYNLWASGTGLNRFDGNVVIGQATQQNSAYKLDVYGNVRANQIVVNTTGADFVFKPSYRLYSLSYIDKYIKQNHHLPEIPSAKQMQTDGLNVGENQVKLLQKVEELTLYLIEKDKQIREADELLNAQQRQLKEQQTTNQSQATQLKFQQEEIELLKQQVKLLTNSITKK